MKYLIVNADDFGASDGINRGVIEAHLNGILTSASLMVEEPASGEAALLRQATPELTVGLHVDLRKDRNPQDELEGQLARFQELMGRPPTHLDSHHAVHRDSRLLPFFIDLARELGVPLREHSTVRHFSNFYGWWKGETHLEQISVGNLIQILETTIGSGITELACHPGYRDANFFSSYSAERESELRTLCDPLLRPVLAAVEIQLISYHQLAKVAEELPSLGSA